MPYPTSPDASTSYTAFEQSQGDGSFPGQELDVDLAAVRASIAATITFLRGVTRSDGKLGNQSVGREQLGADVLLGFGAPTTWETGTVYRATNTVFEGTRFYLCNLDHTAGAFATDLAAGRWSLLADINASGALIVANNLSDLGDPAAALTNLSAVLAAIDSLPLGNNQLWTFHSNGYQRMTISPYMRSVTVAADAAAARTVLGLGTLATQDASSVTLAATEFPSINFRSEIADDGFKVVRLVRGAANFAVTIVNQLGVFVQTAYDITMNASGAVSHSWRTGNLDRLSIANESAVERVTVRNAQFLVRPDGSNVAMQVASSAAFCGVSLSPFPSVSINLGNSFDRWNTIFLTNAPNVSSDARLKEDIRDLNDAERRAAAKIKARTFNMIASGQKKVGYIAQEIIEAMASEGLCAFEYGLVTDGETYGVDYDAINAFRMG